MLEYFSNTLRIGKFVALIEPDNYVSLGVRFPPMGAHEDALLRFRHACQRDPRLSPRLWVDRSPPTDDEVSDVDLYAVTQQPEYDQFFSRRHAASSITAGIRSPPRTCCVGLRAHCASLLALADAEKLRLEVSAMNDRLGATLEATDPGLIEADPRGIRVDENLRAGEKVWAIGNVNGIWPLTHLGEYEGDVVAANIAGESRPVNYEAVPRVTYTHPQAAAVGAGEAPYSSTTLLTDVSSTATYSQRHILSNGFLTLLSDGDRLAGAYALGPEAGDWLQQATLAMRARVPLEVPSEVIQPFLSFSTIFDSAFKTLRIEIAKNTASLYSPMQSQMARP